MRHETGGEEYPRKMRLRGSVPLVCLVCLTLHATAAPAQVTVADARHAILYRLSLGPSATRQYHVSVAIDAAPGETLSFCIPAWTPGYYQILNYQHNVLHTAARDDAGNSVAVDHPESRRWTLTALPGTSHRVTFDYDVEADDPGLGFFGSTLNRTGRKGYINGASAFVYVDGHTADPIRLTVELPNHWRLAAALPSVGEHSTASTQAYSVPNYDALIDCPMQLGQFDESDFRTDGIPFRCILVGKHSDELRHIAANRR